MPYNTNNKIQIVDASGDPCDDDAGKLNVTASLSATDNAVLDNILVDTSAIKTAIQILDDWDDSNYANVNINLAGSDAPTGGGTESGVLRVTLANDSTGVITVDGTVTANLSSTDNTVLDNILTKNTEIDAVLDTIKVDTEAIETAVELLDNAIDGSEMQVDIVSSATLSVNSHAVTNAGTFAVQSTLQAGSNAIGKLSANSGVDIGDVDVTSISAGTNAIGKVGHDITGMVSNADIDIGTTGAAILGSTTCKRVDIMAHPNNTGYIWIGGSNVAVNRGVRLSPGDFYSIDIDDVAKIYAVASVDQEDIVFNYYT